MSAGWCILPAAQFEGGRALYTLAEAFDRGLGYQHSVGRRATWPMFGCVLGRRGAGVVPEWPDVAGVVELRRVAVEGDMGGAVRVELILVVERMSRAAAVELVVAEDEEPDPGRVVDEDRRDRGRPVAVGGAPLRGGVRGDEELDGERGA
eukprot:CAMPEP_0184194912 /NCGR_PEP_ID=MMETSP0976-20121227/4732_1 /TAXON_ID=483370 /ORGANISM="non described non described, Strain CCMP2097" /LENGTH=149 /DNA_ID=CAMNT_0026499347 /DNA_START=39 /DNA_END=487 /DNA_ORIENTATION=-